MSLTYSLRLATTADIDAVLGSWRESAEGTNSADSPAAVRGLLDRDPEALILAVESGEIIGCVIAGWDGWAMPSLPPRRPARSAQARGWCPGFWTPQSADS